MANFKTHISFGIAWAVLIAVASIFFGMQIMQSIIVFTLAVIGSGLPDIDSDTSRPVEILFGILGVVLPLLLYKFILGDSTETELIFISVLFTYIFVQHVLAKVFHKFTKHRGIFHSIPAAIVSGEITYLIFTGSELTPRLFFAGALAGGYLSHLILDEVFSVDLKGIKLKSSLGSALAFSAPSKIVTAMAYFLILILGIICLINI